jgi:Fe2+ or Zn2+ uptake regulation protein
MSAGPGIQLRAYAGLVTGADDTEEILDLLRARGGRVTAPRRVIIEAIVEADDHHLTADALAEVVHRAHPEINRSTVYRTLDTLTELEVVDHVHLGHGPAVYHLAEDAHHHLVCDRCGAIIELPADAFDDLRTRFQREHGFVIDAHHFAFGGLCENCA